MSTFQFDVMVTTRRGTSIESTPTATTPRKAKKQAPTVSQPVKEEDLTLKHVLVLFRHGDRSPITTQVGQHLVMDAAEKELWASKLPTDEHIEKLSKGAKVTGMEPHLPPPKAPRDGGVFPNGQLTVRGLEQLEAKGKALREHYSTFLNGIHESDVYIRSTNVRRTIRSCLSLLHGAFPELVGDDRLHIRINTDVTLEPSYTQADYQRLLARYKDPNHPRDNLPPLPDSVGCTKTLDEQIRKVIGIPEDESICYTSLREVLVCRNAHDVPFPEGMDREMCQKLVDYNTWEFHALFGDDEDCYNSFQKGVDEIFTRLHGHTTGTFHQKANLMACHDSTLIALWNAMKLEAGIVFPVYGALTAIELYQDKAGAWFLQVKVDHEPIHFKGHKHALLTPFDHLEKIVHAFLKKEAKRAADEEHEGHVAKKAKVTTE
ncbi:unnamed protein product [Aphanomyces euteiches]